MTTRPNDGNIVLQLKHEDSLAELEKRFATRGFSGEWTRPNATVHRLRLENGVGIHWCESTGTIWLDGPHQARRQVAEAIEALLRQHEPTLESFFEYEVTDGKPQRLEEFVDKSIALNIEHGNTPHTLIQMRERMGTVAAITSLVPRSIATSGYLKAIKLNLIEWSLEAAVCRFPSQFDLRTRLYALLRLTSGRIAARQA